MPDKTARILEQIGYIKGKLETMESCLQDIKDITEHDIWFPAWSDTGKAIQKMKRLIEAGAIR